MKRLLPILFTAFLSYAGTSLQAQDYLPQTFSVAVAGGLTLPHVEGNCNDFFSKNGDHAGYDLMLEGRYYFTPNFALGVQYDYLRIADLPDKMHLHYARPTITFRHLWSNGNQGAFLLFGIGYMNYQERTYQQGNRYGHLFKEDIAGYHLVRDTNSVLPGKYRESFGSICSQQTGLPILMPDYQTRTGMMTEWITVGLRIISRSLI